MIEYLFPSSELHTVRPQLMNIGDFITFVGYNPLGRGNQAVHNSGSSMLLDTPKFRTNTLLFINNHFKYSENETSPSQFIFEQVGTLLRFKNDLTFRSQTIRKILTDPLSLIFSENIDPEYLYISLILFFVKEYNFFRSRYKSHVFTFNKVNEFYASEDEFITAYVNKLLNQPTINYLSDVCFGRYYFLEVHFQEVTNIRVVPWTIVSEFLSNKAKQSEDFDLNEQKSIQVVNPLSATDLERENNRTPLLGQLAGRTFYKTNSRISKTVLINAGYLCEIDKTHNTFFTKRNNKFSEGHHLIPMAFQARFLPVNIDRSENIVSLCPTCHRAVHLGNLDEKSARLRRLFNLKIIGLSACGVNITFDELLTYYI